MIHVIEYAIISVNLKRNKIASYFTSRDSEIAENCNVGQARYGKTIGKPTEQRRGIFFYRGKGEVEKAIINKSPLE